MKTRKIAATFAILMMALGIVGFTYAAWSKNLYISGTVNTGTLDAAWSTGTCWDEPEDGDISYVSCTISQDGYTLTVTITNAYPSHHYYCNIDIHNTGTVPLHIFDIATDTGTLPSGATLEILPIPDYTPIQISTVLNPYEAAWGTLHVHITDAAAQGATYAFTITVTVENA